MARDALWYRRFGAPEEVLTLEAHEPGPLAPGMLRVAMHAAPVNPSDLIPITGAYGHRVRPPLVAGYEGVGTVTEAGSGYEDWLGRHVLPLRSGGTWASFVDCDAAVAVPVPDDIDDTIAARAYINPVAALLMLKGWPVAGRRILLTAAGSNCAALLAEWALGAGANTVIGICRSRMHDDRLRGLDMTVLPDTDLAAIRSEAARADIVFDAVGGPLADSIMAAMPQDSAFVGYGLLSERPVTPGASGPALQRFHVRDHLARLSTDEWRGLFDEIWPLLRRTTLPPARSFALADWQSALALFRTAGRQEKPLLLMR
ncbi:zinc-dependent alcohol dehydrogenase family protein [Rhizobium sp. PAMB 3182]